MARRFDLSIAAKLGIVSGGIMVLFTVGHLLLDVVAPTQDAFVRDSLLLLGAILSAIGITVSARYILRPLQKMTDVADIISIGNFNHRIDFQQRNELGTLAQAINAMADRLQMACEELRRTNARLAAEVTERTQALEGANLRLQSELARREETESALRLAKNAAESANRTKTLFLANMSHELRTPLHAIIGFSEILENQLFGPLGNDRYREYVTDIRQSGTHLLKLINGILDVSRMEAGMFDLDEETIDLAVTIEACFQLVDRRAQECGTRLRQHVAHDLPFLRGDQLRIRQILVNLLDNAIKFTPEGGLVSLEASLRPDGRIEIRIGDTGIGIKAEDLPKVTSIFAQADSSLTRKHDGAGLGLPLAKALVEKHGGTISIESTLGVGTRVTVLFPAKRTVVAHSSAASAGGE